MMDGLQVSFGALSFLDAGCGSGILSLAAAGLGFHPIVAFDHDPDAVRICRENLDRAGVHGVDVECGDLAEFAPGSQFRLVVANILADVLARNTDRLVALLDRRTGPAFLVLSGMLADQYPPLLEACRDLGLTEVRRIPEGEWVTACLATEPSSSGIPA